MAGISLNVFVSLCGDEERIKFKFKWNGLWDILAALLAWNRQFAYFSVECDSAIAVHFVNNGCPESHTNGPVAPFCVGFAGLDPFVNVAAYKVR
ncbi:hypothetical protein VNO77_41026 [Canavalia gladiata]|uniref:Uncharacterized protein n=1 Tax=Canavalia gladiata TaxID=3824 RepID=A0AAN9PRM5_CANGL